MHLDRNESWTIYSIHIMFFFHGNIWPRQIALIQWWTSRLSMSSFEKSMFKSSSDWKEQSMTEHVRAGDEALKIINFRIRFEVNQSVETPEIMASSRIVWLPTDMVIVLKEVPIISVKSYATALKFVWDLGISSPHKLLASWHLGHCNERNHLKKMKIVSIWRKYFRDVKVANGSTWKARSGKPTDRFQGWPLKTTPWRQRYPVENDGKIIHEQCSKLRLVGLYKGLYYPVI